MKRTILSLLIFALGTLCSVWAGHFSAANSHLLRESDAGMILQDDYLYYMEGRELTIVSTEFGQSGLCVAPGATAYIYLSDEQRLTVIGGNAEGMNPAGAGIEVPPTSTLYVMGSGYLECHGGKSGVGTSGEEGGKGVVNLGKMFAHYYRSGDGGAGGNGGGGAGAGIGGHGGRGGKGGVGVSGFQLNQENDSKQTGSAGLVGGDAENGGNSGRIYFVGTITVQAHSGEMDSTQYLPTLGSGSASDQGGLLSYSYVAGSGGPGGTGNNGLRAMRIGGGGGGAAGAGSGASGGLASIYHLDVEDVLIQGASYLLSSAADAIAAAVLNDPMHAIAVLNLPGTTLQYRFTVGDIASYLGTWVMREFRTPLQANGGGGKGSFIDECAVPQVNGLACYFDRLQYSNFLGQSVTLECPDGGAAGKFGQRGILNDMSRRSWMSCVNQDMPTFVSGKYPAELVRALTFDMTFDTTGVDLTQPYAMDTQIVYSDSLPATVPVPVSRHHGVAFTGYVDQQNRMWYDREGRALPTCRDTLGQNISIYNNPGDLQLHPRWQNYTYILVRHHLEMPAQSMTSNAEHEYGATDYQLIPRLGEQDYTVYARNYPHYLVHDNKNQQTVHIADGDTLKEVDFYYDREQYMLQWSMPHNVRPIGAHTPAGATRVGEPLRAPVYAQDTLSGGYYYVVGWSNEEGDTTMIVPVDFMPARATNYYPHLCPVKARIALHNNDSCGIVTSLSDQLGTHVRIAVLPKEGWLLDTCYATAYSYRGGRTVPLIQTDNQLVFYADPAEDSIAVDVRYLGTPHILSYNESESLREASMTLYINGDSVGNDGGVSLGQTVHYGDRIMLRPERSKLNPLRVPKQVEVTTLSCHPITIEFIERYTGHDEYEYFYSFTMPNEDIQVTATYGLLNDQLVRLRVICDSGADSIRVFSNRGTMLNSEALATTGYMVDAEQLVWVHISTDSLNPIDSIRLRIQDEQDNYSYQEINRQMFVYADPTDTIPTDTTKAPIVCLRHVFRMPASGQEVLLEVKHLLSNYAFEGETTDLRQLREVEDGRIYTPLGIYMGTNPAILGRGIYIRNGKKFLK